MTKALLAFVYAVMVESTLALSIRPPTCQVFPGTDTYAVEGFYANTGLVSNVSSYSMNVTLNQQGCNPFTVVCHGTATTDPPLTYLPETKCVNESVSFSWSGSPPSGDSKGGFTLKIFDDKGFSGLHNIPGSAYQLRAITRGYHSYYINTTSTFNVERSLKPRIG
ncbi:hypothetical protein FH972_021062 [Carpinus fangiana]|uniref:Uncharacterized protein n=1 Tax=Carpinus fangiana TaxID=176857 RepID=A0A5N6KNL8_9ROSI|nr:hypothetical protein FH972_021062 [Carpinus fangiana]